MSQDVSAGKVNRPMEVMEEKAFGKIKRDVSFDADGVTVVEERVLGISDKVWW